MFLSVHVCIVQACADKLTNEMKDFGYPPVFPKDEDDIPKEAKVVTTCSDICRVCNAATWSSHYNLASTASLGSQ